jgi:hypothetical protein
MSTKTVPVRISTSATPTTVYTSPSNTATLDAIKVVANAATTFGKIKVELTRGGNTYTLGWINVPVSNPSTVQYFETFTLFENIVFLTSDIVKITTHESITYDFFIYVTE